jgi:tRNA C32,U32 (ribose-2'-O)-methylase TrmJ
MNLGQAAAVCLYELASRAFAEESVAPAQTPDLAKEQTPAATSGSLDRLAGVIEEAMTTAGYSPRSMQAANRHDLRLLLRRLAPTDRDTRRILGLFRRILWRLGQNRNGK